jgi:hypothetical protein
MPTAPQLHLGNAVGIDGVGSPKPFLLPAHHLTTHGVIMGMTGSGKTGLVTVLVEEALRSSVPVLMIDVKGDLPNLLLAFPSFDPALVLPWVEGAMAPGDQRSPGSLAQETAALRAERLAVWGYTRSLSGTQSLRALCVFDEVYGFLPPHPANPPTKRPLVALMKQARAFGIGVLVATQNPLDLDYRALGNAGLWCLGRLQTDADRERVLDGICSNDRDLERRLSAIIPRLAPQWFVVRNVRQPGIRLVQPRWAMSWLRGPMTREELRRALGR